MASPALVGSGNGRRPPPQNKRQTAEFRRWTGINLTDARTDIEDTELFWLENGISIGKGVIQILNGPGDAIATLSQGIASMFGFTLNGVAIVMVVGSDGSLTQVTVPGGVQTVIGGGAGTVSTSARMTIWQGTTILIEDPTFGYSSWDGTTYTVIDATMVGTSIAVFQGSVWLGNNRTITFTAPATFNDFTAGNGAGSVTITDEAFIGNITFMLSAVEQLWIVGPASVETISNVQASGVAPSVVRTFAISNVVPSVGSSAPSSGIPFFRAIAFFSPGGIYAISGVSPQKISKAIDRLFPGLMLTGDVPAAVSLVQNLYCMLFLVTYTQANTPSLPTPANGVTTGTPLVLGFSEGKMFFASQGATLKWITSVIVNGVAQAWGADGSGNIFQLFGAAASTAVPYKIVGKLHPLGKSVQMKGLMKLGVELETPAVIDPQCTIDSDLGSKTLAIAANRVQRFVNASGQTVVFTNSSGQTVTFVGGGLVLPKQDAAMFGHFLGWTLYGTDAPFRLQAIQYEYVMTRDWNA
jgi:hypothetical protein